MTQTQTVEMTSRSVDRGALAALIDSYTCGPVLTLAQRVHRMDQIPAGLARALQDLAEILEGYAGQDGAAANRAVKEAERAVQEAAGDLWPCDED